MSVCGIWAGRPAGESRAGEGRVKGGWRKKPGGVGHLDRLEEGDGVAPAVGGAPSEQLVEDDADAPEVGLWTWPDFDSFQGGSGKRPGTFLHDVLKELSRGCTRGAGGPHKRSDRDL